MLVGLGRYRLRPEYLHAMAAVIGIDPDRLTLSIGYLRAVPDAARVHKHIAVYISDEGTNGAVLTPPASELAPRLRAAVDSKKVRELVELNTSSRTDDTMHPTMHHTPNDYS